MKNNQLVSIILPSYNGSTFLQQSIDSVIAQTYPNWELILVDDCSTDNTFAIMERYQQNFPKRIKCTQHKKNLGLPCALNTGFATSVGEYLTWTSDDNLYHKDAILKMMSILEENNNSGMVYCDYYQIDEEGELLRKRTVEPPEKLVYRNCVGACFLYRRSVHIKIGQYSKQMLYAEDYDYWLRVASQFDIQPLHEYLYYYRIHKNSLRTTIKEEKIRRAADIALSKNLTQLPWLSKDDRYRLSVTLLQRFYYRRDYQQIINLLIKSIVFNPKQAGRDFLEKMKRR